MYALIRCIVTGNRIKKVYEETSVDRDYLFRKFSCIVPDKEEAVLLFNNDGGILRKGVPGIEKFVRPIVGGSK